VLSPEADAAEFSLVLSPVSPLSLWQPVIATVIKQRDVINPQNGFIENGFTITSC
jgi:hypothetical protein